jgi:ABC-type sugar transport system permease subunit
LIIAAVYVVPIVDVVRTSLFHKSLFGGGERYVGLDNFSAVVQDVSFLNSLGLTALWTLGTVILEIVLGLTTALILLERHIVNRVVRPLILLPWVLSGVVVAYLWRWLLSGDQSPINTLLSTIHLGPYPWLDQPGWALASVIIANVWKSIPFVAVMYLAGLSAIPSDLYEAAAIDGANAWQRFLSITLPGLRAVSSVLVLLLTIWTVTFFDIVYVMTGGGPVDSTLILPLLVYRYSFQNFDFGSGSAVAILLALVNGVFVALYALLFERRRLELEP